MTDKKIRGQNFNYLFLEERENTIEFETNSESDDIGKFYYLVCNALQRRFNCVGTFKVSVVFVPEDEVEDV